MIIDRIYHLSMKYEQLCIMYEAPKSKIKIIHFLVNRKYRELKNILYTVRSHYVR